MRIIPWSFLIVASFALGCGRSDTPSAAGPFAERFKAAGAIGDPAKRSDAYVRIALDAADSGDVAAVNEALGLVGDPGVRFSTASASAIRLAQIGKHEDGLSVARTIGDPTMRDTTLTLIARGTLPPLHGSQVESDARPPQIKKAVEHAQGDLAAQIKKAEREMEQRSVWFVIDGLRDEKHRAELFAKTQGLRDAKGTNSSFSSRGGYSEWGACFQFSPISDIEAAAAKVDFGLVLALDPVERIMVVDASAKPAPRPQKGWPGAKAIDDHIVQSIAKRFADRADRDLVKKFGRDKVAVILAPSDYPIHKKLAALDPQMRGGDPGLFGLHEKSFNLSTVGPVAKLSDVTKLLDAPDVAVAEERRFIIVDFAGLKPRRAEVKEQPAPPK